MKGSRRLKNIMLDLYYRFSEASGLYNLIMDPPWAGNIVFIIFMVNTLRNEM